MKLLPAILAASLVLTSIAFAQDTATSPELKSFIESSEKSQKLILQNTREILERVSKIDSAPTTSRNGNPDYTALEARIAAMEKLVSAPAATAAPAETPTLKLDLNVVWIVITAALVFFMQAGFCLLELGLTRAKNAINICMKNFLDFGVGAIVFLFIGFALMFGSGQEGWIGWGPFWISDRPGTDAFWAFWLFQVVFAGTAATIISGAMAERTKFVGYLIFTVLMTGLIYPIAGHWAWGSFGGGFGYGGDKGWLEALGYVDFAGSSVVHGIGGAAALAGILVVGARRGRFRKDGTPNLVSGHNLPLAALGTFILWFGWYGFNAGSTLVGDASIGRIAVNTTLAPSAGAITAMICVWITQGKPDLSLTLNGALGGLVGITANCHIVTPASAVVIGVVAGILATLATSLLERLRIDDAVGAVPVHLFCGFWGVLAVALFNENGFSPEKLGIQALGIVSITGFSFVVSFASFSIIDKLVGLRASDDEQDLGLDFTEHSGAAYPDFTTSENEFAEFGDRK